MKHTIRTATGLFALLSAFAAVGAAQEASFTLIPAQNTESVSTSGRGISADGSVAVGVEYGIAWRWTEAGGTEYLSPQSWENTFFVNISDDASTIISTVDDGTGIFSAALYTDADGWTNLGGIIPPAAGSDNVSTGYAVNGDGSVAVGLAWVGSGWSAEAFTWNETDGMTGIGRPDGANSRANDVSPDGSVIVGWYEHEVNGCRRPARWTDQGPVDLFLGAEICGEAAAVSSDGTVIVGQAFVPGNEFYTAFRYSDEDGWLDLGRLGTTEWDGAIATGIADNGTIVGLEGREAAGIWYGFIWTARDGMRRTANILTEAGVTDHSGWHIAETRDISVDGRTIVGTVISQQTGYLQAYVATIPSVLFDDGFEAGDTSAWSVTVGD